jgi:8-amino-7-oxononanoate synthase
MFTASLPPSVIASVAGALDRMLAEPALRTRLLDNARRLHSALVAAGFELGPEATPILSIRVPDAETAIAFWNRLVDRGVYINLALPPATPRGICLLRSSVSAAHEPAQLDAAARCIIEVGTEMGLIGGSRRAVSG